MFINDDVLLTIVTITAWFIMVAFSSGILYILYSLKKRDDERTSRGYNLVKIMESDPHPDDLEVGPRFELTGIIVDDGTPTVEPISCAIPNYQLAKRRKIMATIQQMQEQQKQQQ